MKKSGFLALVAAAALLGAGSAQAAEGALELSGNVNVVTGWQHDNEDSNPAGVEGSVINSLDAAGAGVGQLGDFRGPSAGNRDTFNFYIDQVELDASSMLGENIRIRADLDFGRGLSGTTRNVLLEQGYVTANIPAGNGIEFLIGRFNTPIGLESVDRGDNIALSYSNIFRFLRPHNTTGAKFYYAFSDNVDLHLYAVNNLWDTINETEKNIIPSYGARVGFNWGEKGQESTVGLSYAGGPEGVVDMAAIGLTGSNSLSRKLTHIADLDFNLQLTEAFTIAGEAIYRIDDNNTTGNTDDGSACYVTTVDDDGNAISSCQAFAAQVTLGYQFNESWDGYLRYEYFNDLHANYTGYDQQIHAGSVGVGYQIAEAAKMKLEYRLDLGILDDDIEDNNIFNHGVALSFNYDF